MKKYLFTLILISGYYFATAQEYFQLDSIISDTVYITKSSGKYYENQTFIDRNYKSLTSRTEIQDTTLYISAKAKLIQGADEEIGFINQNLQNTKQQIKNMQSRKNILALQKARHQKLITRLRKKY